jgi:CO dehydrogenase maturation factor
LLGELEVDGRIVVFDMEAGVATLLRMEPGQADVVLVVAQPSAKSIEVARRAVEIASDRAEVVVLANRVRNATDLETIRAALPEHELVVIPDDPVIERADREGLAPIDVDATAPGVRALRKLADRLARDAVRA